MQLRSSLAASLTNHTPTPERIKAIETVRQWADEYALVLDNYVPDSREKSLAKTKLEESVMWAVKAIVLP